MQEHKPLIINIPYPNRDDGQTVVEDPFSGMRSTYDALRADPQAMPELSPETRAAILAEIANGTAPAIIEDDPVPVVAEKAYYIPNRHERRKHATLARKERREKQKAKP